MAKVISGKFETILLGVSWFIGAGILLYLASLDVPPEVQLVWTVTALLIMIVLRVLMLRQAPHGFKPLRFARLMIMLLAGMIALRYLWWRLFHSIPLDAEIYSMVGGLMLYLAEVQSAMIFFLGAFVYLAPRQRDPEILHGDEENLPVVDVLVPTYNESAELLRVTMLACTNLQYPADKLNIYLLDDGGTEQLRNHSDPVKALAANDRHREFKAMCEELGVSYMTRARNENAKAGNINAALRRIHGDLVVVFDSDHVPTTEFLQLTVAQFLRDEKLWLVQTPHFLVNDDPVEKNIGSSQDMPSESEMFYTSTMRGMDNWNSAFFCGSGAAIRRKYLNEIGGIATQTVTEDIETSVEMHRRGYNSIYLHRPMLAGLQPETFAGFITQRLRWAHGMLQVFMMKNPLIVRGLSLWQRLCYLHITSYWFFSYMRLVFLLAPTAYLIFGISLYDASVPEILLYGVPYVISYVIYFNVFFGRMRWFLVSEVYETLQSLFAIRTVFRVLLHPKRGRFLVTPKDENIEKDFITPLARSFFPLVGVLLLSVIVGFYKVLQLGESLDMNLAVTFWGCLNLCVVLAALGALYERRQVRHSTRFDVDMPAGLKINGKTVAGRISDLSATGLRVHFDPKELDALPNRGENASVEAYCRPLKRNVVLPGVVTATFQDSRKLATTGFRFTPRSVQSEREIIALAYGDGERWRNILKQRNVRAGLTEGLHYFFTQCLPQGFRYLIIQVKSLYALVK